MKISIELKIGIIGIVTIALVIWGVNFLKGRNILSNSYTLYALYDNAGGIEVSTPVLMNGVKIGYVDQVELNPKEPVPVRVKLNIEKKYSIRRDSWSILFSSDLLGTKAIRIEASDGNQLLRDHDTIQTLVEQGMFASLQDQLEPVIGQIGALAESLDSLSTGLDRILNSETATGTVDNLSAVSKSLRVALEEGGSINQGIKNLESFTAMLKEQEAGAKTADVCRKHGISSATFYKFKAKFGGMEVSDARKLKALEDENRKLKKLLAETMLDVAMLKDLNSKKW